MIFLAELMGFKDCNLLNNWKILFKLRNITTLRAAMLTDPREKGHLKRRK